MDIRSRFGSSGLLTLTSPTPIRFPKKNKKSLISPSCSSQKQNGNNYNNINNNNNNNHNNNNSGDNSATDWDKAWSKFKKQGKRTTFSKFNPNKYVSWNPRRSEYPLSEEVDPIKRVEKSNLMLWTSPRFTLGGAIVIVTFLLVYTLLAPII